jgi:hypothetical protein
LDEKKIPYLEKICENIIFDYDKEGKNKQNTKSSLMEKNVFFLSLA